MEGEQAWLVLGSLLVKGQSLRKTHVQRKVCMDCSILETS